MAPPVYTEQLCNFFNFGYAPNDGGPASVPEGYRWIIRDVAVQQPAPGLTSYGYYQLNETHHGSMLSGQLWVPGLESNLFSESGRNAVVDYPYGLSGNANVGGTSMVVSGWVVTLP